MNILELKFYHFRNYDKASFSFEPKHIILLKGDNAQGKTNIIEAIYFLAHLRSFRTNAIANLCMHNEHDFFVQAKLESQNRKEEIRVSVENQKKRLFHFDDPVRKFSDFVGICNAILFCPDDLNLFTSSPGDRRKFIDMELVKLNPDYTFALNEYQKLLKLKNAALKQEFIDWNLVHVYTQKMAEIQTEIIEARNAFIQDLMRISQDLYPFFSKQEEKISAKYKTFVSPEEENLALQIDKILQEDLNTEKFTRVTYHGIHKDDIIFYLNGEPVSASASQGQKRSFLLALKIGLAHMIYQKTGEYPIMLLDDVFSELDPSRKTSLIENLPKEMQIFITSAEDIDFSIYDRPYSVFHVEKGQVKKEES